MGLWGETTGLLPDEGVAMLLAMAPVVTVSIDFVVFSGLV